MFLIKYISNPKLLKSGIEKMCFFVKKLCYYYLLDFYFIFCSIYAVCSCDLNIFLAILKTMFSDKWQTPALLIIWFWISSVLRSLTSVSPMKRKRLTCDACMRYLVFHRLHLWLLLSLTHPDDGKNITRAPPSGVWQHCSCIIENILLLKQVSNSRMQC